MQVFILNQNLEVISLIDDFVSLIWCRKYIECGDVELCVLASQKYIDILKLDYYIIRNDDETAYIIESVDISQTDEGDQIIVKGRCLKSILARRIVWQQTNLSGNVENAIRLLVSNALTSAAEGPASRGISNFILGKLQGLSGTIEMQITGDNLLDSVSEICTTFDLGYKVTFDNDGNFVFDLCQGKDRTISQSANKQILISESTNSLLNSSYSLNNTGYRNAALVAGEGEGLDRKTIEVTKDIKEISTTGLQRKELYVDARDVSSNDGQINADDYNALLAEQGIEGLSEATTTESLSADIDMSGFYQYKTDYDMGDKITILNEYGIQTDVRIVGITESWDENGQYSIETELEG